MEDKVPVKMRNIQTKAKQQKNDVVANIASNNQQQKEVTSNGQRRKSGRAKV